MSELQEETSLFTPVPIGETARQFLNEHPKANWEDCLQFILDKFPQQNGQQVQWLLEGGTAMHLLFPEREPPKDIDAVSRTKELYEHFKNSGKFDIKPVDAWFESRNLPYTPVAGEQLLNSYTATEFKGNKILTLSPVALATSKTLPWGIMPRREQDSKDIDLLGVPSKEVSAFISKLRE